ncbi:MAG TPA: PilN domain-containing protein [Gammaproteobacteria bacterium]|nr:PilN domain-containing protein [Gammaproteobacteria bacterium]
MPRINLLPWREERRKQRQRQFNIIAGTVAGVGLLTVGALYLLHAHWIEDQNARNAYLGDQIKLMEDRIAQIKDLQETKNRLVARMQIIQHLQESRPVEVHLFDQLVHTLPPGVYLTAMTQKGDGLSIAGVAESSARVSAYLRNLDASPWLGEPNLVVVQKDPQKNGAQQFQLTAKVVDKAAQQAQQKETGGAG